MGILEAIDDLIDELRYWPSRGSFVREACLEKVRSERNRLRELKNPNNPAQAGGLNRGSAPDKAGDVTNRRRDDSSPKKGDDNYDEKK